MLGELQRLICKMDIVSLLEEFVDLIRNEEVEVYNEFSLQHELGIFLRAKLTGNKVQFERNVKFFGITGTVKHEIDIVIYNENEKYAIELKYPLNGQYPEQMYSFVKDIKFMEQLKEAGFMAFLTNRFCVEEVIGGTVIIHLNPDDFYSQHSGGSGKKIACGQITY